MKVFQRLLFGGEVDVDDIIAPCSRSRYSDFRIRKSYRRSRLGLYDKMCCGTCDKFVRQKRYFKCRMMGLSNSVASDIRKSFVCDAWSKGREHALDEKPRYIKFGEDGKNHDNIPLVRNSRRRKKYVGEKKA